MRNPKYHIYLTPDERRTVINSLIDLRNDLISKGRYTDIIFAFIRFFYVFYVFTAIIPKSVFLDNVFDKIRVARDDFLKIFRLLEQFRGRSAYII